jgi:hypothetical protein
MSLGLRQVIAGSGGEDLSEQQARFPSGSKRQLRPCSRTTAIAAAIAVNELPRDLSSDRNSKWVSDRV